MIPLPAYRANKKASHPIRDERLCLPRYHPCSGHEALGVGRWELDRTTAVEVGPERAISLKLPADLDDPGKRRYLIGER